MVEPIVQETRVVHGHRVAYVRAGSGPALVLLHGIANNCQTWAAVIERLAETHTVIAPDLLEFVAAYEHPARKWSSPPPAA